MSLPTSCEQSAQTHLATLLPHAWETQRASIYQGVSICTREKHVCVCVQARSLAELSAKALWQPSVLHKPR